MRYTDYLENNTRHLNYKNNISTRPVWLLPCKGIPNKNNIEKAVKKNTTWWYKQIASFYENEKNFFILMNEDELYVLPKKDFVIGDVDEFRQYIETKICTKVML